MAVNPNTMSNAEYAAYAQNMAQPVGPQLSVPADGWLQRLAADMVGAGTGVPAQQRGIPQIAVQPQQMPVVRANGAHYSPDGMREGWQEMGIPPVLYQRDPYATAAWRVAPDPYGQMGVQPLVGFASRYPHVLSGVPNNPLSVMGFVNSLLPQAGYMPFMGMGGPVPQGPRGRGGNNSGNSNTNRPAATSQKRAPFLYGDTDTMPLPAAGNPVPAQAAAAPGAGPVHPVGMYPGGTAPVAGNTPVYNHPMGMYPSIMPPATTQHPVGTYPGGVAPEPGPFTADWLTPEEAAETADGMYVDPNRSLWDNILDAMSAVSIPITLGTLGSLYSTPRYSVGALPPEMPVVSPGAAVRVLP